MGNEPKIIWIKALGRLKSREEAKAKFKFNSELKDVLSRRPNHFVMDVQRALANVTDFSQFGDLSGIGKLRFWNEFNRQLELFELKDISLKPVSKDEKENQRRDQDQVRRDTIRSPTYNRSEVRSIWFNRR